MDRNELIDTAVGVNENYRINQIDHNLELGFLYGTAEMVTSLIIGRNQSYSELREEIAREIDKKTALVTYPVLPENGGIDPNA